MIDILFGKTLGVLIGFALGCAMSLIGRRVRRMIGPPKDPTPPPPPPPSVKA